MDKTDQVKEDVAEKLSSTLERGILDNLAGSANARAVFGDPVDREDITVIPVARVKWAGGVGHGGGHGPNGGEGSGGGGGGASIAVPTGYIVIANGDVEYRPIRSSTERFVILGLVAGLLAVVFGPSIARFCCKPKA